MRKSTKLAILVAALVALCTMAAFAADTWKQDGDNWYCLDSDGQVQIGVWKKSGNNYYYLDDSTGVMVKNKLVETDGYKYWCGADGARVIDQWVQVPVENDDDGWEWMYFKSVSGKAAVGDGTAFTTVKGKKYLFNSDGYMLYGYLLDMLGGKADGVVDCAYYMGTKNEGSQFTGWQKFVDGELSAYPDTALCYFYFKNGLKITSKYASLNDNGQLKIDGKYYTFGDDGKMVNGVYSTMSDYYYYGAADDGSYKKKVWVKTSTPESTGDDYPYWYYFNSDGVIEKATKGTVAQIKKINSKYYLLSEAGRLKTGLVMIYTSHPDDPVDAGQIKIDVTFSKWSEVTSVDLSEYPNCHFYYFNTDSDTDGTMKTGSVVVKIDDEEKTLVFDKHGVAYEGVVSKKIYNNGILQTAGDSKYAVKALNTGSDDYAKGYYLVNASGSIMNNTRVCDSDGIYWVVLDYNIAKVIDKEYSSQLATALKNKKSGFKVGSNTYEIKEETSKSVTGKYKFFTYEKNNDHTIVDYDWTK